MTKRKASAILLAIVLIAIVSLFVLEGITVSDAIPGNHITALVRGAYTSEPGVFIWLAFSTGFLGGHFFWYKKE